MKSFFIILTLLLASELLAPTFAQEAVWPAKTYYRYKDVNGHKIFYREAGNPENQTILLLHGYPSSSHTYRELIPLLSGRYHVIAPDNLGSGYSDKPDPSNLEYSFDLLAEHIEGLVKALEINDYIIYMQDFGAPVGFRVVMNDPTKVKAIIAQNANVYIEGISETRKTFFYNAQLDKSEKNVNKLYKATDQDGVKNSQYLRDVKGKEETMSPDSWTHDSHFLESDKDRRIQVELFQDYKTNLDNYPKWQAFLRKNKYPTLIVWGKNDPVFIPQGAKAYLRDVPNAELHLLNAGHFAVEEKPVEIAKYITSFINNLEAK